MVKEHVAGRATVFDKVEVLEEHFHSPSEVYPRLANPVTLTKAAGAWAAFPVPTEIVPANIITEDFDVHFISVSGISANGDYLLCLYEGSSGVETSLAEFDFSRTAVQSQEGSQPVTTRVMEKNSRVSAALSSGNAAQDTANIKVRYHTY